MLERDHFGYYKGKFSDYAKQNDPFLRFFGSLAEPFRLFNATFIANGYLREYSPSISQISFLT
jgi:hypothetical protein